MKRMIGMINMINTIKGIAGITSKIVKKKMIDMKDMKMKDTIKVIDIIEEKNTMANKIDMTIIIMKREKDQINKIGPRAMKETQVEKESEKIEIDIITNKEEVRDINLEDQIPKNRHNLSISLE